MGVLRAGIHGTVGQPSAQVVDGSLKFDKTSITYLARTPASAGNRKVWTLSYWIKLNGDGGHLFSANNDAFQLEYRSTGVLLFANNGSTSGNTSSTAVFRDFSEFYHVVIQHDAVNTISRFYINGTLNFTATLSNADGTWNNNTSHNINGRSTSIDSFSSFAMSQVTFIDGQALGPEYFGYTDGLTNTWRPKKYEGTFGTNGFYLPMDGNSPIGEDKSGQGNNWTPVNFGGSVALPKATGALPILNTDGGGNYATAGVRTDPYAANLVLALPLVGNANDVSNQINSGSTTKAISVNGSSATSASSNFYSGSWDLERGSSQYLSWSSTETAPDTGDFTYEVWFNTESNNNYMSLFDARDAAADSKGFFWGIDSNGQYYIFYGTDIRITAGNVISTERWYHGAVTRQSGILKLWLNGVLIGTYDTSNSNMSTDVTRLGSDVHGANYYFDGKLQDARIYIGVAKYTSNFIPASTNPDILPDTPSSVSGGSKLTKITDGAVSIPDSNSRLSLADSDDAFNLGSGDWTIESFVYLDNVGGDANVLFFQGYTSDYLSSQDRMIVSYITTGGIVNIAQSTTGTDNYDEGYGNTPLGSRRWYHLAYVRNGSNLDVYVDGKKGTTRTARNLHNSSKDFAIGSSTDNVNGFDGFISNFRLVRGTAVYTANFTPPIRELTNVTNTKLLCCQSNTLAGTAAVVPGASGINDGTPWSEFVTIPEGITGTNYNDDASNAFDGDTSTHASLYSGNMVAPYSPTTVVFTPPSPITVSTGVRVYMAVDRGQTILINGTQTNASVSAGWNDTGFTGTLTSLTLGPSNLGSSSNPAAFEVDGVILKNLVSPKGNTSATNFNPFNTDINTVRGQETGYATINPLTAPSAITLSNGNLDFSTGSSNVKALSTIGVSSGKWYWESGKTGGSNGNIGIAKQISLNTVYAGGDAHSYGYAAADGKVYNSGSGSSYGDTWGVGDVIGVAFDADNRTLTFYKNGILQGVPVSNVTSGQYFATAGDNSCNGFINFGQKPFKFSPPDGFQPLNAANVRPETVITRPNQYVGIVTYTGDNSSTRDFKDFNFAPDLVWYKERTNTGGNWSHTLFDTVRGNAVRLQTNSTSGETAENIRFLSDGFGTTDAARQNTNNANYVTWCWKAGGNKNTFNVDDVGYATASAAGLTAGTITPTGASVGTKQGFSIVKYQGTGANATIPHGLSQPLDFLIVKTLTNSSINWTVWHSSLAGTQYLILNTQGAAEPLAAVWNSTVPTSSVISVGTDVGTNKDDDNYIAYCWHDVPGLQKFGSFEANQSADGPFIELGFRPAVVWIKNIDNYDPPYDWVIYDNTRSIINPNDKFLSANLSNVENSGSGGTDNARYVDFLSNGFKVRTASTSINLNAHTQIYCAWAEAPVSNLYGGQSNAR